MRPQKSIRRFAIAIFVMVSLLFSQMALASYVCPGMSAGADAMAQAIAEGEPCEGMDSAQPALCHQQAASAPQTFEVLKVVAPSLPAVIQVLVVVPVMDTVSAVGVRRLASVEAQPPPDPLFLSTLRLRV